MSGGAAEPSARNDLLIEGRIVERDSLRYTPAGIPIVRAMLAHSSEQAEAGGTRQVEVELACVAVEEDARLLAQAPIGVAVRVAGFLTRKSRTSRQLVLHATRIEFLSR